MPYLELPDGNIFYEDKGEGEPVLCFRGLGRSSSHWLGFDKKLANNYRVITLDARGLGRSTAPCHWELTVYDLAADGFKVLDHLGIDTAHVMGISLGGMKAMAAGLMKPERVRTLTIINSSVGGHWKTRISMKGMMRMGYAAARPSKIEQRMARILVSSQKEKPLREVATANADIAKREGIPYVTIAKQVGAALRFNCQRSLEQIKVPSLILYGTEDNFVPKRNSILLGELIPNAAVQPIKGGGHELTVDSAEQVVQAMTKFIDAQKRIRSPKTFFRHNPESAKVFQIDSAQHH